ncbi:MAG TPA: efflux RND transporter periplasmic adaptor subunit [Vicinamibacterales bacterium]|nr:efflux RND transporter periplasmic adaptor subunit [Vicinamibacterales bacterium]
MSQSPDSKELQARLGVSGAGRARRIVRWVVVVVVLAVVGVGAMRWRASRAIPPALYRTEPVASGTLTVTVTATGELKALTQVNIGTEISGVVESVAVDYNSPVRVGQILARVNTEKLEAQSAQARAALQSAEAKRLQSQATLAEAQAELAKLQHVRELSGGRVPSRQEIDSQEATVKRAQADEVSSEAQVAQSKASLAAIETDIRKAVIKSPINGIVLDRQVDPGQTVAASFQTPTLFTLAEDLTKMKLIIDVDEADIGNVKLGQAARFRVDAYPDRTFESRVQEVRSTPKTSNGVVTYQTVLTVNNSERLLQPGMTATAEIVVTEVANALLVPNAALRFTPPAAAQQADGGFRLLPRPPGAGRRDRSNEDAPPHVWTETGTELKAVDVALGPTDGKVTVLRDSNLAPGTPVIVDLAPTNR